MFVTYGFLDVYLSSGVLTLMMCYICVVFNVVVKLAIYDQFCKSEWLLS